jgi:hypothetical protein
MALRDESDVGRWSTPDRPTWVLVVIAVCIAAVAFVIVLSERAQAPSDSSNHGSGVSVTDVRELAPFTSVELAGANTVVIHVGGSQSVTVTGDDNLVDRVTTVVEGGRLLVDNTGSFTTDAPMRVTVSAPSLDAVELSGAGTVTVDGIAGDSFTAELTGDGTLVTSGAVDGATFVLAGAGTLDAHDLVATDASAQLQGTGTLRVNATSTLDATLSGTGTILYQGDPTVTIHDTGTGTVVQE